MLENEEDIEDLHLATRGTPYSAVFNNVHSYIFAGNPEHRNVCHTNIIHTKFCHMKISMIMVCQSLCAINVQIKMSLI